MAGAQEPGNASTQCQRIAWLGAKYPRRSFTSLAHHIDVHLLAEAYRREVPRARRRAVAVSLDEYARLPERSRRAMAQAYLDGCYTMKEIAAHFGVHYATVSRAVKREESG